MKKRVLGNCRKTNWQICHRIFPALQDEESRNTMCVPTADNTTGQQKDKAKFQIIFRHFPTTTLALAVALTVTLAVALAVATAMTVQAFTTAMTVQAFAKDEYGNPSDWAESGVRRAISLGLVPAPLQTEYAQATTRAEFCAFAVALHESVTGAEILGRQAFDDTDDVNVEKMAAAGVVNGTGDNMFSPGEPLTREQAATMLARLADAAGRPLKASEPEFDDNDNISSWAVAPVGQVQAAGIMQGEGPGIFAPKNAYAREQSIITILRVYDIMNETYENANAGYGDTDSSDGNKGTNGADMGAGTDSENDTNPGASTDGTGADSGTSTGTGASMNPIATITMENGSEIVLELFPSKAPNTVNNFIHLASKGYYDGLTFHRVAKGFMIQGGCPLGTGTGGPGYSIMGEFANNGFTDNDISHQPGVISMARSTPPDSAGSQFFICAGDASFLDGNYAAFGQVVSGLDAVYKIAELNTSREGGLPSTPQVIKSIAVNTKDVEYQPPDTM